jgi:hypothetical protein
LRVAAVIPTCYEARRGNAGRAGETTDCSGEISSGSDAAK